MSQRSNVDACISLALVGDSGVGKTCLTNVFADGSYNEDTPLTVGANAHLPSRIGWRCAAWVGAKVCARVTEWWWVRLVHRSGFQDPHSDGRGGML